MLNEKKNFLKIYVCILKRERAMIKVVYIEKKKKISVKYFCYTKRHSIIIKTTVKRKIKGSGASDRHKREDNIKRWTVASDNYKTHS